MEKQFHSIHEFVLDLNLIFPKNKHIAIYTRLIEQHKTDRSHIEKHLSIFKKWLLENQESVLQRKTPFKTVISYSDTVLIDLSNIMLNVTAEDENAIWQHLMNLNYLFFPTENNKRILKETMNINNLIPTDTNEGKLIENAFERVTANMSESSSSDPSAVMSSLLTSGAIGDIMTSMNSGNIDPKKLIGIAQNMLKTLSEKIDDK